MSKGNPRITVRFDREIFDKLYGYAEYSGQSVADFVRAATCRAMLEDADFQSFAERRQSEGINGQIEMEL